MVYLETLPLLEGADVIVIDEGLNVMYARTLIAGWLRMWEEKRPHCTIDLISVSDPSSRYKDIVELNFQNLIIHDCYTLDVDVDTDKQDSQMLEEVLKTVNSKSIVIIDCLSSLIFREGRMKALQIVKSIRKKVSQLICIYRRYFVQNPVPQIETLGTTYVRLEDITGINIFVHSIMSFVYLAKITHRKPGGKVLRETELVNQDVNSYQITSKKQHSASAEVGKSGPSSDIKIESSFRLEMTPREMEQKEKVPLPYTLSKDTERSSRIIYQPDETDDIDEDDPDDDLCF